MAEEGSFVIAADHPALPGHFPGNPVVPGAVLLDRVLAFAQDATGSPVGQVLSAKFRTPLEPGIACRLRLARRANGAIEVTGEAAGAVVLVALLETEDCVRGP